MNKKLVAPLLLLLLFSSCHKTPFLVREPDSTNKPIFLDQVGNLKNALDPKGNGTIDPNPVSGPQPVYEKGLTKIVFNKGENNLSFKIKLSTETMKTKAVDSCTVAKCVTDSPDYQQLLQSPELKNFKSVKGEVTVDSVTVPIEVDATSLLPDLSHALDLIGLAKNSVVKIKATAYDKDGKIMGEKEYEKTITEKVDTVQLEILINKIQEKIK
jgi:hypothetical protein